MRLWAHASQTRVIGKALKCKPSQKYLQMITNPSGQTTNLQRHYEVELRRNDVVNTSKCDIHMTSQDDERLRNLQRRSSVVDSLKLRLGGVPG